MNLAKNRQAFANDIEFLVRNVILPNRNRYVTVNGKAVIFLWATPAMEGDFASLLLAVKEKYPVFFLGSIGVTSLPEDPKIMKNFWALDGFMEYALVSDNYLDTVKAYDAASVSLRQKIKEFDTQTKTKHIFIPTWQAAFDDTRYPGRTRSPMYPKSREEAEYHAELIKISMGSVYDNLGPFVVYSELPEGAAVIESQCLPETSDIPGRFVGCGKARLEILKKYFGDLIFLSRSAEATN
jgi:hypothetical protein